MQGKEAVVQNQSINKETLLLEEAVAPWWEESDHEAQASGFAELCNSFGFDEVMTYLSGKYWDQSIELGLRLKANTYFNYTRRPATQKKTIAAYYRSISNGGAQRVVAMLCNLWAELRDDNGDYLYNVILITDKAACETEYSLNRLVKRVYLPDSVENIKEKYACRFAAWQEIITEHAIDVVISSMWVASCTFWDLLAVKGHPSHPAFLIHSHNSCAVPFSFNNDQAMELTLKYQLCDGVVALSACDELYIKCFNNNVRHIVNPIAFNPDQLPNSCYRPNTLVWCGRFAPEKRPVDAVRALACIVKVLPATKLLMVGDGSPELMETVKQEAARLGIEANLELVGFTLDVGKYYGQASVMLVTSEYEGFLLTIGEALAYAVPVVSYDMPYLTFLQDGRGIITVPQGGYKEMAEQVIELLKEPGKIRELGLVGKQHITDVCHSDIEGAWRSFFAGLDMEREEQPLTLSQIVLRQISELQYKGRCNTLASCEQRYRKLEEHRDSVLKDKYLYRFLAEKRLEGVAYWKGKHQSLEKELATALEQDRQNTLKLEQESKARTELEKRLERAEKKLNNIQSGLSFKIGRIITYLPRKLFGKE